MAVRPLSFLVAAAALLAGAAAAHALPLGPPPPGPAGAVAAAHAPAPTPPPGRVTATLEACHQAADLASRYATFAAQMTAVPGTAEMSIRFELDERTPPAPGFHPVGGVPGFGVWTSSAPGVGIFGYDQEVSRLTAPAAFRVTVSYRWLGPRHRLIRRARRMTPACALALPPSVPAAGAAPAAPEATVVGSLCPADSSPPATAGSGAPAVCR